MHVARSPALLKRLGTKPQREVWKAVNEASLPLRALPTSQRTWGKDRFGADLGDYPPEQFAVRSERTLQLAALEVQHWAFLEKRERERGKWRLDSKSEDIFAVTPEEIEEEKLRRKEIASLRMELYGQRSGTYSADPMWDDVIPMPVEDSEGALAAIAYPEEYAEGMLRPLLSFYRICWLTGTLAISYLRAVMASKEYSPRCLQLTQHIISLNPAHYTVWLYRFSIAQALDIPIPNEIDWLNQVSLANLKNYQIWHHRRLLMDHYIPTIESSPDKVAELAKSEQAFLAQILAEDTKNYHVWSYRQYLVPKLNMFGDSEIQAAAALIDDDVRNNSAWSHRFFVIFSDPTQSTPGSLSTEHDAAVPAAVLDREVAYAQEKILLAPQNQSPWNYMRGVLVKSGRGMSTVDKFVSQFVTGLGTDEEKVTSTHGLEMLAEVYVENGDSEKADLCLRRLGEKWDRIRLGYWQWRRQMVKDGKIGA